MNSRRKFALFIVPAFVTLVTACGGGDSDTSTQPTIPVVEVSSINAVTTINRNDQYKLVISGSSNNVTIAANNKVVELTIFGLSNNVTLESTATIDSVKLTGSSNTLSLPTGYSTSVSDTGLSNQVIQR